MVAAVDKAVQLIASQLLRKVAVVVGHFQLEANPLQVSHTSGLRMVALLAAQFPIHQRHIKASHQGGAALQVALADLMVQIAY